MNEHILNFEKRLQRRRLSRYTVHGYVADVRELVDVLGRQLGRGVQVGDLTLDRLQEYVECLPGSATTVQRKCASVRSFCRFLFRAGHAQADPGPDLIAPKSSRRLPHFLHIEDCERLTAAPLAGGGRPTLLQLRDKAILEVLWGGGLRAGEARGLRLDQLHFDAGKPGCLGLRVIGKGDKERFVVCPSRVAHAMRSYLDKRNREFPGSDEKGVFVSAKGTCFAINAVYRCVIRYARPLGIKAGAHTIRHSCATHLLDGGAELRHVQEFLGHSDPRITSLYTHVTLKGMVLKCTDKHPMEKAQAGSAEGVLSQINDLMRQVQDFHRAAPPAPAATGTKAKGPRARKVQAGKTPLRATTRGSWAAVLRG